MSSAGVILVVDDDVAVSDLLTDILRERGYRVEVATHGHAALGRAARARPDAVILDLNLPDMSGAEALPRFLALDPTLAIVVLTGTEDETLARSLLEAGAVDYVSKPFDVSALERTISRAVAVGRQRLPR